MTSLAPVPSDGPTCANCNAPLVADQCYCLSCGQPASPVRLAFLDVLQSDRQPQLVSAAVGAAPAVAYATYAEPHAGPAWLRRYAPLFAVAAVLLLAMIAGLLVGHWATQSKGPSQQVIKVEGLGGGTPASAASSTPASASASPPATTSAPAATSKSSAKEEKEEEAEAKAEEKKPVAPPKPKTVSSGALTKLTNSTGKKHQEEINKIGTAPIEVP